MDRKRPSTLSAAVLGNDMGADFVTEMICINKLFLPQNKLG